MKKKKLSKNERSSQSAKVTGSLAASPRSKESPCNSNKTRSVILLGLALIVITLSVYRQVGNHQFIDYDDNVYVYE